MTLQQIINSARRIVFFGGAGVSTESNIPDFRSTDGLYNQKYAYPPETILSRSFFETRPAEFFDFYRDKMLYPEAKPNNAHLKLVEIEKAGKLTGIVTQNIDGLHQMAGSVRVFELHGSVHRNYCMECGKFHSSEFIMKSAGVPKCECGGVVKPDVVLYQEGLDDATIRGALRAISDADTMIVAGTSLTVYPAAGFLDYFTGKHLVLINRDPTPADHMADLIIREPVGKVLGEIEIG
ncbi:MAG: NAD-dependent protein deacylase [Clostridia bacterium]|nr:NAD-dependent protein deacylase [Clostridia bacterium]